MEMYGAHSKSWPQKIAIIACELVLLALSYPILFGTWGAAFARWIGWPAEAALERHALVFAFSIVVFARMTYMMIALLHRQIPLAETFSIPLAFSIYYIGFPLLTLRTHHALGGMAVAGIFAFIAGSILNTISEAQRARWKSRPENQGHLCTGGLFAWSMHINYFGDLLWVVGYALVSRNPWAALIPIGLFCFFAFFNVPKLDAYLRQRYGAEFDDYARRTAKLVPWIY